MANPTIVTQFAMPDPDASPLNLTQLFQLANVLVRSTIPGDEFLNIIISGIEPGPEHRDTIWLHTDGVGRPIEAKIWWHGHWRRIYNGMMGEVRGFTGAPGLGPPPALFNADGRGNIGLEYDGWHICNGKDGVVDLSDKFIIGAHMNNANSHTGYNNGWQTFVDGKNDLKTGGSKDQQIGQVNLPGLDNSGPDPSTGIQQSPGVWLNGNEFKDDPDNPHTDAQIIIDTKYANLRHHSIKLFTYGADTAGHPSNPPNPQQPLPILPPFYAMAWITFVGYENV